MKGVGILLILLGVEGIVTGGTYCTLLQDDILGIPLVILGGLATGIGITLLRSVDEKPECIGGYVEEDKMRRLSEELRRIVVVETLVESRLEEEEDVEEKKRLERTLEELKRLRRAIVLLLLISRLRQQTAPYYL